MRIDFHVHSKYSKRPSQWFLKKLGCPECFTEPMLIYRIAKAQGMSLVTISDHNTIAGALEIAHLPDVFVSEEVTTYFPEDGCKLHVLVVDISEKQHEDIQKVRKNLFEFLSYLNSERIFYVIAHCLYDINGRLTADHFEKALLLFKNFEINGARDGKLNLCLKNILSGLTAEVIDRLAEKHCILPVIPKPWEKHLIGGSDDHSALHIAETHTKIPGAGDIRSAVQGIESGRGEVISRPSTPQTMAHNLYGIAYQYYRNHLNLHRFGGKDMLIDFLDRSLTRDAPSESGLVSKLIGLWPYRRRTKTTSQLSGTLLELLRLEARRFIADNRCFIASETHGGVVSTEGQWFEVVNQVSNRVLIHFADHLMDHISGAHVFNIFQSIGSAGGLYTLLAPYFVSFSYFSRDYRFGRKVEKRFSNESPATHHGSEPLRVAHFTDTFYDVNGVALSLQQQVQIALRNHKRLTVMTCDTEDRKGMKGVQNFKPIGVYQLPEYPELRMCYPPLLEMLNYCYEQDFTQIHSATPGPMGLAALAIARILRIPISGTYHTALPQYAQILTGDESIEDLMWRFVVWYYDQMDYIHVPSRSTGEELVQKGIHRDKIKVFPRGIDIQHFHPSKRNGCLESHYGIRSRLALLYVGRVSKEKNLHLLCDAFKKLRRITADAHLVIVGDGPYANEMKTLMQNEPCTFTGYLEGEDLAAVYASSDLFVFPSTTDTFGNVVLEAQASGLPVIVTDKGGPQENIEINQTGIVVAADDAHALLEGMIDLVKKPERLKKMGRSARKYMENRSFDGAFIQTWKLYKELHNQPPTPKAFAV